MCKSMYILKLTEYTTHRYKTQILKNFGEN